METLPAQDRERPIRGTVVVIVAGAFVCGVLALLFVWATGWLRARHAGVGSIMLLAAVYGVAVTAVALTAARLGQRISRIEPSSASRRYARRFTATMLLYVFAMLAALYGYFTLHPAGALAYALAVLPAAPLVAAIAILGVYLHEETDEFQRAVMVEAALWATGGTLAACTVWGFLETFRLVVYLPSWLAFVIWSVLFGPGQILARLRYR